MSRPSLDGPVRCLAVSLAHHLLGAGLFRALTPRPEAGARFESTRNLRMRRRLPRRRSPLREPDVLRRSRRRSRVSVLAATACRSP
jgi:hypothetical protein